MKPLREQEFETLRNLCNKYNVQPELIKKLISSAEENHYANKSVAERRTDYLNLIQFHSKQGGKS